MLVQGARNGLSVLRLAWQREAAARRYANAASFDSLEDWLEPAKETHSSHHPRASTSTLTSNEMASDYFDSVPSWHPGEGGINFFEGMAAEERSRFLEGKSDEYNVIAKALPPPSWRIRPLSPLASDSSTANQDTAGYPLLGHPVYRSAACDTVANAVAAGNFMEARRAYGELKRAKVKVAPREVYLKAVDHALLPRPCDYEDFFFWLELVPFRPQPDFLMERLPQAWYDLSKRVLRYQVDDTPFVKKYLLLAADRGLLFHVFDPLFRSLTRHLEPALSLQLCTDAIEAHCISETVRTEAQREAENKYARSRTWGVLPNSNSEEIMAETNRRIGQFPHACWNQYLRLLMIFRHLDAAKTLFESAPSDWTSATTKMVSDVLGLGLPASKIAIDDNAVAPQDLVDGDGWRPALPFLPLAERIRSAVSDGRHSGTPNQLASLIAEIQFGPNEQSQLLQQFKHDYSMSARHTMLNERAPNPFRQRIWIHGMMVKQRDAGDYEGVIKTFASYYRWEMLSGILPRTVFPTSTALDDRPHPNVINTLMSALIALLPNPIRDTLPAFHRAFLQRYRQAPPGDRLDDRSHAYWIRLFTTSLPPKYVFGALQDIWSAGYTPGELSWVNVLTSLARWDRWHSVDKLVDMAETGQSLRRLAAPLPTIGMWTYFRLWTIARMCCRMDKADEYRLRGIERIGVDVALVDRRSIVAGAIYRTNAAGPFGMGQVGSPRPSTISDGPRIRYHAVVKPPLPLRTIPRNSLGPSTDSKRADDSHALHRGGYEKEYKPDRKGFGLDHRPDRGDQAQHHEPDRRDYGQDHEPDRMRYGLDYEHRKSGQDHEAGYRRTLDSNRRLPQMRRCAHFA